MNNIAKHYDILIDMGQDPVHDPDVLKEYMNKWDGQAFIDLMMLDKSKTVLEIGVGTGRIAAKVAHLCKSFTGIDISEKTVIIARENINNGNIICGDFLDYEFDKTFDVVYSSLTFMHFKDKHKAFENVYKVLNDKGVFVLSIDKNQDEYIDIGASKIKIYPDTPQTIKEYANIFDLTISEEIVTEFAYVFKFSKL